VVPDHFTRDELPDACAPMLGRVNAPGPHHLLAWVDLARCVARSAIAQLELDDSPDSVALLEEMTSPSFVLLDHVTRRAAAATTIEALHAKADIYGRMGDRMLATVSRADRDRVEQMIEPWNERARAVYRKIIALGDAHPELSWNPGVRLAIRDSERHLAAPIATRED
jgi:hypothetical protein